MNTAVSAQTCWTLSPVTWFLWSWTLTCVRTAPFWLSSSGSWDLQTRLTLTRISGATSWKPSTQCYGTRRRALGSIMTPSITNKDFISTPATSLPYGPTVISECKSIIYSKILNSASEFLWSQREKFYPKILLITFVQIVLKGLWTKFLNSI